MPLEGRQAPVEEVEVVGPAPDVGALEGDQSAQLGRHTSTVTGCTQGRQLARPIEGQIERAEADQEPKPFDVRRGVPSVAVCGSLRGAQYALGFIEPNGFRGRARLASQLADLHTPNGRPSCYWNVKQRSRTRLCSSPGAVDGGE